MQTIVFQSPVRQGIQSFAELERFRRTENLYSQSGVLSSGMMYFGQIFTRVIIMQVFFCRNVHAESQPVIVSAFSFQMTHSHTASSACSQRVLGRIRRSAKALRRYAFTVHYYLKLSLNYHRQPRIIAGGSTLEQRGPIRNDSSRRLGSQSKLAESTTPSGAA